jgi:hypothetical protein
MDGNLSKALWIGVSILLFVAVVTIGLVIFGEMKQAADTANQRIGSIQQNMAEEEFRIYDGKEVNGNDVISAIGNFSGRSGDVLILVATLGGNTGNPVTLDPSAASAPNINNFTKYISETGANITTDKNCFILTYSGDDDLLKSIEKTAMDSARRDAENPNKTSVYINPSGRFMSHLLYDQNNKIRGIIFAQMK